MSLFNPAIALRKPSLLVIDDDAACAIELAELLESYGFTVYVSATVAQSLELAGRLKPDLAIIDLELNGQSGLELIPIWRVHGPRMLILSGRALTPEEIAGCGGSVPPLLLKPIDLMKLLAIIAC